MKYLIGKLIMMGALMITAGAVSAVFGQEMTGAYADADPNDKEVVKAAEFAAKKLGTEESVTIAIVKIEKARLQVVAGLNYEVCMEVTMKRGAKKVMKRYMKAVVYRDLRNRDSLSSWTVSTDELKCGD